MLFRIKQFMFELVQLTLHVGIFHSVKSKMKFFLCKQISILTNSTFFRWRWYYSTIRTMFFMKFIMKTQEITKSSEHSYFVLSELWNCCLKIRQLLILQLMIPNVKMNISICYLNFEN